MKKWFFAILPPTKVSSDIISFQEELKKQYGFLHALKTPPHLTIIPPFEATTGQIDSFCDRLQIENISSFSITLDGFQAFHPRVVFVDVAQNQELSLFAKKIKRLFAAEKIVSNQGEKHFFTPHITIANRDLTNKKFKEIFPAFEKRGYQAFFTVDALHLLLLHEGRWEQFRTIKF